MSHHSTIHRDFFASLGMRQKKSNISVPWLESLKPKKPLYFSQLRRVARWGAEAITFLNRGAKTLNFFSLTTALPETTRRGLMYDTSRLSKFYILMGCGVFKLKLNKTI